MDFASEYSRGISDNMALAAAKRKESLNQFYPNKEQLQTLGRFQGALYGVKELTEKLGENSKVVTIGDKTLNILKITETEFNEMGEEVKQTYWHIDIQTQGNPQFTRYILPTDLNSNMLWQCQQINRIKQTDQEGKVIVTGSDVVKSIEFGFSNTRDGKRIYTSYSPPRDTFLGREDAINIFEEDKETLGRAYMQIRSELPTSP